MWAWPQSVQNDNLCYIKRCGSIAAPSFVSNLPDWLCLLGGWTSPGRCDIQKILEPYGVKI